MYPVSCQLLHLPINLKPTAVIITTTSSVRSEQLFSASHWVALMVSSIAVVFTTDSNDTAIPSENFDEDIFETLPGREGNERSQIAVTFPQLSQPWFRISLNLSFILVREQEPHIFKKWKPRETFTKLHLGDKAGNSKQRENSLP